MKQLFISQPMKDKTFNEIRVERAKLIMTAERTIGKDFVIMDSYRPEWASLKPLECLAEGLKILVNADFAIFSEDWREARGCVIEYLCCEYYGIPIIE